MLLQFANDCQTNMANAANFMALIQQVGDARHAWARESIRGLPFYGSHSPCGSASFV